jgi:hypothetical protein
MVAVFITHAKAGAFGKGEALENLRLAPWKNVPA